MKGGVRHPVDYAAGSSKASGKANRREVKVSPEHWCNSGFITWNFR